MESKHNKRSKLSLLIEKGIKYAIACDLDEHRKLGRPIVQWDAKRQKPVWIPADQIPPQHPEQYLL